MKINITKVIGKVFLKIVPANVKNRWTKRIETKYRKLYIGEEAENKAREYVAQKMGISIVFAVGAIIMGIVYMARYPSGASMSRIERPGKNEGEKTYNLVAYYEDETEMITVNVGEKEFSYAEAMEEMDKAFEAVKRVMLNGNKSTSEITSDLKFVSELSGFKVKFIWDTEDEEIIGSDGKLNYKGEEPVLIKIFLTEECGEYSKTYEISIKVMEISKIRKIEEYVQDYVKEQAESEEVYLPESIDDKGISFTEKKDDLGLLICVFGVILSVVLFYAKDRDVNDDVKKRDEEIVIDYPDILSKYLLLYKAGFSNVSALERIVKDYEKEKRKRYAYEEIKLMLKKIKLGRNELDCYDEFGRRMGELSYMKLAILLEERTVKGNSEISSEMELELKKAWDERSKVVRIYGQRAGTKLVMPMVVILSVTLCLIIVPAFLGIKGGL